MAKRTLAAKLRVLRAQRGLTIMDAAAELGVDRHTLRRAELGTQEPQYPTLAKIAEGYGVPVEDLLDSTEEVITFDDDAVRAAINSAKAGKLTRKEAARAIADSVRGGPADALEDAVELLLEHAERRRSEDREAAKI